MSSERSIGDFPLNESANSRLESATPLFAHCGFNLYVNREWVMLNTPIQLMSFLNTTKYPSLHFC
jgi:hypothetical protein